MLNLRFDKLGLGVNRALITFQSGVHFSRHIAISSLYICNGNVYIVVPIFLQCSSNLRGLVYRVGTAEGIHISLSGLVAWASLTMIGFPLQHFSQAFMNVVYLKLYAL